MNQNNNKMQGQGKEQQGQGQGQSGQHKQPETRDGGNPSTTERIQPNQGGGNQQPEGDDRQRNQQAKF